MTKEIFQKKHGETLKAFMDSECGRDVLGMLSHLRPPYEFPAQEHLLSENRGAMRGYEMCMRNLVGLTIASPQPTQVQQDYGVPTPKSNETK